MSRSCSVFALLTIVIAARAAAAPILVAQFTLQIVEPEFGSPPTTVDFGFRAYQPGQFPTPVYLIWQEAYETSDVGATFSAPVEVVDGANDALRSPTAEYSLEIGPANFATWILNQPSSCTDRSCLELFVPNVAAHLITSVERIIDRLVVTPQGDGHLLEGTQRIRFWGEPIPEPETMALLAVYILRIGAARGELRLKSRRDSSEWAQTSPDSSRISVIDE